MPEQERKVVSPKVIEGMMTDWASISRKGGSGMMAKYLYYPSPPNQTEVIQAAFSSITLALPHIKDYLPYDQHEKVAQFVIDTANKSRQVIKQKSEQRVFDGYLAKNVAFIRGFSIEKASTEWSRLLGLSDSNAITQEDKGRFKEVRERVDKLLVDAAIECINIPTASSGEYGNNLAQKVLHFLANNPTLLKEISKFLGHDLKDDELQGMITQIVGEGKLNPGPIEGLNDIQQARLAEAALELSKTAGANLESLDGNEMAQKYVKRMMMGGVVLQSDSEQEKLSVMLEGVKDLWSMHKDNIGQLGSPKRQYLSTPSSAEKPCSSAEEAFEYICAGLCKTSKAKQLDKLAHSNPIIARYSVVLGAMEQVGGSREYPQRSEIIETLLPELVKIDPVTLQDHHKAITKLCTQVIEKNSSKSLPIFGNNTVTATPQGINGMREGLQASLAQFQRAPNQEAAVARPASLPAGMPAPASPPVVDRSKAPVNAQGEFIPKPPADPFPSRQAARPAPAKSKKEQPKVVTTDSFEKREQGELLPHGMPAPKWHQARPSKSIPPVPQAVPLTRTRSAPALGARDKLQDGASLASQPPRDVASPVSHGSTPIPVVLESSQSPKHHSVLVTKGNGPREIEEWKSSYKNLGFAARLGLSRGPTESHKNPAQSVKAWREWYEENQEKLDAKGFAIPEGYKEVREIASQYNTSAAEERMLALQQEIQEKRAARLSSAPANIKAEGGAQEHDTPYPPPRKGSMVEALHKRREEDKGGIKGGGRG